MSDETVGATDRPSGSTRGESNSRERSNSAREDDLDDQFATVVQRGDRDALAVFIARHSARVSLGGGHERLRIWLDLFSDLEISASAPLSVAYGTLLAREGDIGRALIWLDLSLDLGAEIPLGDRRTVRSAVAAMKSAMGVAEYGYGEQPGVLAALVKDMFKGWQGLTAENFEAAEAVFAGLDGATELYPMLEVVRLTSLATVADALEQTEQALGWIALAQGVISANRLERASGTFHCDALAARLCLDSGDRGRAQALAELCAPKLVAMSLAAQQRLPFALIELADVYFRLGRPEAAKGCLAQARLRLSDLPHMAYGQRRLQAVTSMIAAGGSVIDDEQAATGVLTLSESRVLQYLPTHLSLPQIAAELFVSPSTVRTHVQSIYRKLRVVSRSDAVTAAKRSSLLP